MIAPDYALPPTRDTRPKRGSWAPGLYACTCCQCGAEFTGDKRSTVCAACAYAEESGNHDRAGEIMDAIVLTGYDARVQELFAAEITAATERGRQAGLIEAAEITGMAVIDAEVDIFRVDGKILENQHGHTRFVSTIEVSRVLKERESAIRARANAEQEGGE